MHVCMYACVHVEYRKIPYRSGNYVISVYVALFFEVYTHPSMYVLVADILKHQIIGLSWFSHMGSIDDSEVYPSTVS
jgi:hypothetical protein